MTNRINPDEWEDLCADTERAGRDTAITAATWATAPDEASARRILEALEASDPEAWDWLPPIPTLNGEYGTTRQDLAPPEYELEPMLVDDLARIWEEAAEEAFEPACVTQLLKLLPPTVEIELPNDIDLDLVLATVSEQASDYARFAADDHAEKQAFLLAQAADLIGRLVEAQKETR